jgi:hypothetical protein
MDMHLHLCSSDLTILFSITDLTILFLIFCIGKEQPWWGNEKGIQISKSLKLLIVQSLAALLL